jgi:hypothetical protein
VRDGGEEEMRVDPGGGSGFAVDPAQLKGAAGQLGRAYDDFNTAIDDYAGAECYDQSAFGDFGMGAAWSAFDSAWAGEMGVTSAAISELIGKVNTTADNYSGTEDHVTGAIKSVGVAAGSGGPGGTG